MRLLPLAGFLAVVLLAVATDGVLAGPDASTSTVHTQQSTVASPAVASPAVVTPAPAPDPEPEVETVTIAAVGDILMGSAPGRLPPGGGAGFFDQVAEPLRADLTIGNLETPLSEPTGHVKCTEPAEPGAKQGCFAFRLPPSYAGVLRAGGFHVLTLANNHTNDAGPAGLRNTRTALAAEGLLPTGGPDEIAVHTVRGIRVAVLGFGPYSWMSSVTDLPAAARLIRAATQRADLVVVNMHVGAEGVDAQHLRSGTEHYLGENRGDPIAFAHAAVEAGAHLVVGHSPHVLRGMEFYRGRLIAYSLGNFAGYRTLSTAFPLGAGGVLRVTLDRAGQWVGGQLVATEMVGPGFPALDPDRRALDLVGSLSAADLPGSAVTIEPDGTLRP